jgi:hypothetical protein
LSVRCGCNSGRVVDADKQEIQQGALRSLLSFRA